MSSPSFVWRSSMQMYVYLIHFKYKLHHAGHYVGFSKCLHFRIASHRDGTGAKLLRAITRLGIPWMDRGLKDTSRTRNTRRVFARFAIPGSWNSKMSMSAVMTFARNSWKKPLTSKQGPQSTLMVCQPKAPEKSS